MPGKKRSPLLYEFCALFCCILWGIGNPMVKIGGETLPPFLYASIRFGIALAVFLLFCGRRIFRAVKTDHAGHVLLISFFNAAAYVLGCTSLFHADATISSFLMSISVVFTPVIGLVILKKRINPGILPAIAVALAGLYLICGNTGHFSFGLGELLALLCSFSLALAMVLTAKYGEALDLAYLAAAQCLMALVLSLPFFFLLESWVPFSAYTGRTVFSLLFTSICCACVPFVLQNLALRHVSPTVVAITYVLEPVFTATFSHFLIHENLSATGVVGGVLIICGVILATLIQNGVLGKRRKKELSRQ